MDQHEGQSPVGIVGAGHRLKLPSTFPCAFLRQQHRCLEVVFQRLESVHRGAVHAVADIGPERVENRTGNGFMQLDMPTVEHDRTLMNPA
ncbi:hypothetical protein D3C72_1952370 [compost metagenome]